MRRETILGRFVLLVAAVFVAPGVGAWAETVLDLSLDADELEEASAGTASATIGKSWIETLTDLAATNQNGGLLYGVVYYQQTQERIPGIRISTNPVTSVVYTSDSVLSTSLPGDETSERDQYDEVLPIPYGTCVIQGVTPGEYDVTAQSDYGTRYEGDPEHFKAETIKVNVRAGAVTRAEFFLKRDEDH